MSTKEIIVESKTTDAFDSNIEADIVLSNLNDFIIGLEKENDIAGREKITSEFLHKVKSWEILTVQSKEGQRMWIQVPFKYEKKHLVNGFWKRINHLFDTGVWLPEKSTVHIIDAKSNTDIPLMIEVEQSDIDDMKKDQTLRILRIVKTLRELLLDVLDKGYDNFGIFKKPNGIIAMNQSKQWMTDQEQKTNISWYMKHTLETQSVYDLIQRTQFKTRLKTEVEQPKQDLIKVKAETVKE